MKRPFLKARWENLIMANYAIDPELLIPYLPAKTELDTHNGKLYVSLVGFMFLDTQMLGFSIPFHINFEEVNLRFYVRHNNNGVWKRGVVFISEIVPKIAISLVANILYREKYRMMRMRNLTVKSLYEMDISYQWKFKDRWNKLQAVVDQKPVPMEVGSEEEFIAEHYYGYSRHSKNITFEYGVAHPRWEVYPVKNYTIDCNFAGLYGEPFGFLKDAIPTSVFVAKGSQVTVSDKRTL